MSARKCPECSGKMQKGYLLDKGYGTSFLPKWVEGDPEERISSDLGSSDVTRHTVLAYRCEKCGFLKFYAPPSN